MKFKTLSTFALSLLCSTNSIGSQAVPAYSCKDIAGPWTGKGQAIQGRLTCDYSGNGHFKAAGGNNYLASLNMTLTKSDSSLCPPTLTTTVKATCINNQIKVDNDQIYLTGRLQNKYVRLEGYTKSPKAEIIAELHQK